MMGSTASVRRVLIVNADDFGRSEGVNRGVAIAHEEGIVTSASLMVTRPCARAAAEYASHDGDLSLGLHVDLGEWVYRDGAWETVEAFAGPVDEEIRRQVRIFETLVGRKPTHLDSHQHVHRQPAAAAAFVDLARELGVPLRDRSDRVRYCGSFYGQDAKGEPLPGAITTDALIRLLGELPAGTTELGCHPGLGTQDDLPYGPERGAEVQALCDPRVRQAVDDLGIELRSFARL